MFFNVDIDECLENVASCDHGCINEEAGFRCVCQPGFILQDDNSCKGKVPFTRLKNKYKT